MFAPRDVATRVGCASGFLPGRQPLRVDVRAAAEDPKTPASRRCSMRPSSRVLAFALALGLAACESPTAAPVLSPSAPSRTVTPQANLNLEIHALILAGFPREQAFTILLHWEPIVFEILESRLPPRRPGDDARRLSDIAEARVELARTVAFVQGRTGAATPPSGETKAHYVARLVLDMSLFVYGGPDTPIPSIPPDADVASKLVSPGGPDTVVTPALRAAVVFPAGAVAQPTVVVITPDSTYYPDNCSGPLDTHLCQYPRFYRFNVFPDVKLAVPAKVQVCHVDAGSHRLPLADHNRFRVAHEKPASATDYAPGSTIVDNVEVLAYAPMAVTNCLAGGGTQYAAADSHSDRGFFGRVTRLAMGLASRASAAATSLFAPTEAYAIDVGGGGFAASFSAFAVVDPQSKADLAQVTSGDFYFAPLMTTALPGDVIPTTSWRVSNVGNGTSGAFTSSVVVASDTGLANAVLTIPLTGGASLVPGAYLTYPAQSITLPTTLAPGNYFVGTRVIPSGADSTSDDDWRSFRITVNPVPPAGPDVGIVPGFTVGNPSVVQGSALGVGAFSVKNFGGTTSDPFDLRMVLASDTLLTGIVSSTSLNNASTVLGPGVLANFPANAVSVSPCVAPGTYFVGPHAYPSASDANAANNQLSVRITVLAAAAPIGQSAGSSAWTGSGPGTVTEQINPHCANLHYNDTPSSLSTESWSFSTTAVSTGTYAFSWSYAGLHSWFQSHQALEAFADGPGGQVVVTLLADNSVNTGNGFSFAGNATLPLTAGYAWGVRPSGGHFDSSRILLGTVQIIDLPQSP